MNLTDYIIHRLIISNSRGWKKKDKMVFFIFSMGWHKKVWRCRKKESGLTCSRKIHFQVRELLSAPIKFEPTLQKKNALFSIKRFYIWISRIFFLIYKISRIYFGFCFSKFLLGMYNLYSQTDFLKWNFDFSFLFRNSNYRRQKIIKHLFL